MTKGLHPGERRGLRRAGAGAVIALLGLTLLWPAAASAQQWYWGFGAGLTRHAIQVGDWDDGSLNAGDTDRTDYGFKLTASYEFGPRFALEGALVSLGENRVDAQSSGGDFWDAGPVRAKASTLGLSGSVLARFPATHRTAVVARGGAFVWNTDVTIDDGTAREAGTDTGVSPLLGLGVEISFDRATRVRIEWERYMSIGKEVFGDFDVDMLSATFMVSF